MTEANKHSSLSCFVFAHNAHRISKESIIPMVEYWNNRSEDDIHFFFIGYLGGEEINDSEYTNVVDTDYFDEKSFCRSLVKF